MANTVRVAAAQMTSVNDLSANLSTCSRLIKEAAAAGAKLLCFPENFSYVGTKPGDSLKIAEPLDGPIMSQYRALAKESNIWLSLGGFQETGPPDSSRLRNTHVLIDDSGNIRSKYRKMHLFDVDVPGGAVFKESCFTDAGEEIVAVETPFGTLGLTVCYDLRFPELYQELRFGRGAEVILVTAAFTAVTGAAHWEVLLRARAIETQCYVIAAAQAGKHSDERESYGDTVIIDPWGTVVGRLKDRVETGIVVADIDFAVIESVRRRMPISQHRKPLEFWRSASASLACPTSTESSKRKGKKAVADGEGEGPIRKCWKKYEDERLAKAWIIASTNSGRGNDQSNSSFWGLVEKEYNCELPDGWKIPSRDSMQQHFMEVAKRVFQFENKLNELEAQDQSGSSFETKYHQAATMYEQDMGVPWSDEMTWKFLREQPKWRQWSFLRFKEGLTNATKKMKNNDGESIPSSFSMSCGTQLDTPSDTPTTDEGYNMEEAEKVVADGEGEGPTRKYWKKCEDERLAKAWVNASTNSGRGRDQSNSSVWKLIENEYNHELPDGWKIRTKDNMRQHFMDVAKRVFQFENKLNELEALDQSGPSFEMKYHQAATMYEQDMGVPWSDEKAWKILREQPKWKQWSFLRFKEGLTNATNMIRNTDGESFPSHFSMQCGTQLGTPSDTPTADEGYDVEEADKTQRPMGSSSKDPIVVDLSDTKSISHSSENAKFALVHEHYAKIEQTMATKHEIKQMAEERLIMEKDLSDPRLNDVQREYFMKMQQEILRKRFGK